eukprot:TRINITY_DN113314_c0_g1_i1.p1 TRINITY_DN113314_c0_g1~~TRINITY_DN113314_c0_g1_i1.p1  ORF type:complete len:334 (+),score=59.55 TRINITY_DN113314_c0_g1_i1:114-1115(+)
MQAWQIKALASLVQIVSYTAQGLLISASRQADGTFDYDVNTAVQLAELLKLLFAVVRIRSDVSISLRRSLPFAGIAALYVVQNNLIFHALSYLTAPEYQILNNMKLVSTSVLFRIIMKRQLSLIQWIALGLLTLGMTLSASASQQPQSKDSAVTGHSMFKGVCTMLVISGCSSLAGVYNELLLKKSGTLTEGNIYLYSYCVLTGFLPRVWDGTLFSTTLLRGFGALPWAIVISNAVLGQAISYVFRYADSIVKLYSACAAVCLTTLLSCLLFNTPITIDGVLAYSVCFVSFLLFYTPPEALMQKDAEFFAEFCNGRAASPISDTADSKAEKKE